MPRLKYYNTETNTWEYVGSNGKSAYDYAKDAGFTGSEVEFAQKLIEETDLSEYATQEYVDNKLTSKQDAITGAAGQFVVIGVDGKPTTKTIPNAEEASF